ncbi:hypothetical protein CASFOL_020038 [Castilleja foliolosa]|uniref:Uncharacterized protein n=1 Tax=Castilleja foliolosa TaxID=1961234 RepID=A0ABD3D1Q2_9LAMI
MNQIKEQYFQLLHKYIYIYSSLKLCKALMADDQLQKPSATNQDAVDGNKDDEVVADEIPNMAHDSKQLEFTEDEETLIKRMYNLVGKRWSLIAGRIPGRSAEEIQKYWNSRPQSTLSEKQLLDTIAILVVDNQPYN